MHYSTIKLIGEGFTLFSKRKMSKANLKWKLLFVCLFINVFVFAQTKEKVLFKNFISLCNDYKHLPLQLSLDYTKTSNIILSQNDTTTIKGIFSMQKDGAYINFGGAEQIIADSIVLIVMEQIKQMVITKNDINLADQINKMISLPVKDSSLKAMSSTYNIEQTFLNKEKGKLQIANKQNVYGTDIPFELITLEYNVKTSEPLKIETTKRSLIKKPEDADFKITATIISLKDKGDYFLKEDVTTYLYSSITHDENKKLPVLLTDRIVKDETQIYVPVKAYETYRLVVN